MSESPNKKLIRIIKEISAGNYSNDIMELTTPNNPPDVQEVAEAVAMMMVKIEAREFHLEQLNERIRENSLKTVTSIARALGARDTYTEGHGDRVSAYAVRLGRRIGLSSVELERIRIAGQLHDIGKIGFSDNLFQNEDTRPTDDMMREIRSHPQWGYDIVSGLDFLGPASEYVYAHHERLDGKGYPRGLEGDAVPLGARVLAVSDIFDAVTTDRSYHTAMSIEDAFALLRRLSGDALDPELVEAFVVEIQENGKIES